MLDQIINRIKEEKEKQAMPVTEIAKRADLSRAQVTNILAGKNSTIKSIESVLRALGVKKLRLNL